MCFLRKLNQNMNVVIKHPIVLLALSCSVMLHVTTHCLTVRGGDCPDIDNYITFNHCFSSCSGKVDLRKR